MTESRRCSRSACRERPIATLTYDYGQSRATLGPLGPAHEPHAYDLCSAHAARLTAPRGWEVVREPMLPATHIPTSDDLEALADAVREAARSTFDGADPRRAHLRILRSPS